MDDEKKARRDALVDLDVTDEQVQREMRRFERDTGEPLTVEDALRGWIRERRRRDVLASKVEALAERAVDTNDALNVILLADIAAVYELSFLDPISDVRHLH